MAVSYNLSSIHEFCNLIYGNNCSSGIENILKISETVCKTNNSPYKIIRYRKNILTDDMIPSYGLCRSIIVNSKGRVVCFAPPKSVSFDEFTQKYPSDDVDIAEFVEGTMINVFFDPDVGETGEWVIATRNNVGAVCSFYKNITTTYKQKTFREMFMEAVQQCNLDFYQLDTQICYSFVLQHPENRIVVPVFKPKLYLVGIYKIIYDGENITVEGENITNKRTVPNFPNNTGVEFPETYPFKSYADLTEKFGSMNTPYDVMGVVIYNNKTGERTKIRNPNYEHVRHLRGNQPKLQYQYLFLRKEGKVRDFLHYYPEMKKDFALFRNQVHLFTHTLYSHYISCYIKKERPLMEYPQDYRSHMFHIHQLYMAELREKKLFVTNTFVQKYVNELHPSLLMHSLNFQNYMGSNHNRHMTSTNNEESFTTENET